MRHEASSFSIKTQTAEIVACQIVGPYLTSSLRFGMFRFTMERKKLYMPLFKNLYIGLLLKTTSRQNSHVFSNSTNGTGTFLALALQCVCSCFCFMGWILQSAKNVIAWDYQRKKFREIASVIRRTIAMTQLQIATIVLLVLRNDNDKML